MNKKIQEHETVILREPAVFQHYVMNLPASAVEFLDAFTGVYHGREPEFEEQNLPWIHVYTFYKELGGDEDVPKEIAKNVSKHLGYDFRLDDPELEVELRHVRLVAPKKSMWCVSFRMPRAVAFAVPAGDPDVDALMGLFDTAKMEKEV